MKFIYKLSLIAKTILQDPRSLNKVLEESPVWKAKVSAVGFADGLPVIDFDAICREENLIADPYLFLDGGSLPTDLILLRQLAANFRQCRYFEVGTWRGESVANVAQVAAACFTLNLSSTEMREMGVPETAIQQIGILSKPYQNITHLEGNSTTFDFAQFEKPFDLIFIDGDHHYMQVRNDTEKAYRYLSHPGSIIAWHDYAYHPEAVRFEVLAGILDGLPAEAHAHLYHVSNTKTAILSRGMQAAEFLNPPVVPDRVFSLNLKHRSL